MMRILLIAVVLAIAFSAGTAYATPIACTGPPVTVDVFPPAGPSAATFSCGGLLFSKFEVVLGSGNLTFGQIDLVSATNDNGDVVLNFNPNLSNALGTGFLDLWFYYSVTGATNGIDLTVAGQNATITETACSSPIDRVNANICTGGLLGQLAVVTNSSGVGRKDVTFPVANSEFIFKDINVGPGGALSSFSESHHAVPEAPTVALLGVSIIGLAAVKKRRR